MIVKTGANYQNDGGYIEASANGFIYTLTDNDKIAEFGGSEEFGLFIVPVTIINETERNINPVCLQDLNNIENVLCTPFNYIIEAGETKTINCLGIIGLPMRVQYSGASMELKCESEYITVENSGAYAAFSFVKMPENGEPVTMRLYM